MLKMEMFQVKIILIITIKFQDKGQAMVRNTSINIIRLQVKDRVMDLGDIVLLITYLTKGKVTKALIT